jgi:hypothetical protein
MQISKAIPVIITKKQIYVLQIRSFNSIQIRAITFLILIREINAPAVRFYEKDYL